ncbi:hypothetical protein HFP89_13515 [Wenzhouxiangella sp. XN79A]|uniref:hypothetical protein n=1 Tax=Wenzhouxiangella sp. XN79A TaxID=2724193 RepID=UPI00144A5A27|nr:hypothetical protein [Wenzhouxiangella sp. XN79A]NKI36184.1 hypothetical protein [Wenzhouxiangella sp. XN79A]
MSTDTETLDQRRAEVLGRQFNAALTNATAYGAEHPQMHRACETFCANLAPLVEALGEITLMQDRGAVFIEDYRADENFNANRVLQLFRELGLQSLTFRPGVDVDAIAAAMQHLVRAEELGDVEAYKAVLNEAGVTSIKVNHIVLKKLTAEDEVIEREGLAELTDLAEQASAAGAARRPDLDTGDLLGRIESIFAMRNLIEADQGDDDAALDADPSQRVVAQLQALGGRVARGGRSGGGDVSLDVVLDAVETLKRDLSDTMADQKEVARFMNEHGGVIDEIDQLTYRTVVALVCDEYRAGTTSARRLAQIIRRLLPDSRDIKRLLPMLKESLTDEGMSLSTWLQFVSELSGELKSENLVQVLSEGAEEVGLAVDDIVREIQQDPGEAARLIVLAAELRRGSSDDSDRLSAVLADHIEHATVEMLPASVGGRTTVTRFNRDSIRKVQQELLEKVRRQGMDESVLGKVAEALDGRFEDFLGKARSRQVDDFLSTQKTMDPRDVVEALEKLVDSRADIERMDGTLRRALKDRGLGDDDVQNVLDQALTRVRKRNRIEFIPGDALDPNATRYFLNREILSAVRYKTHFSGLMLMIARIRPDGEDWRAITPEEIEGVMPRILDALPLHLRDLDLLGTLGSKFKNVPLVILPMTPQEGADHVLDRILEGLNASTFALGNERVQLKVVGTAERFDPERTEDGKQFVQALRGKLASHLVTALRAG